MTGAGWSGRGGVDPSRVAQLLVTSTNGSKVRGTGYRVSASTVLTAAHVVNSARRVCVRLNAHRRSERVVDAAVAWLDAGIDVAVLSIESPQGMQAVSPVGFGRVTEAAATLTYQAVGFPRFKLKPANMSSQGHDSYRDSCQVEGQIAPLSNWGEGTLEIRVDPPEYDRESGRSPWEGMSGAAVFVGDRIVGLISEHYPRDGLNRLAATRVDRWYEGLDPSRLDGLCKLIGLAPTADALPDIAYMEQDRVLAGLAALNNLNYPAAVRIFEECLAQARTDSSTHFYLALAMLGGRSTYSVDLNQIMAHLRQARVLPSARVVATLVDECHYRRWIRGGFPADGLADLISEITADDARLILRHVYAVPESHTWNALNHRAKSEGATPKS